MTNHLYLIARSAEKDLADILRDFKIFTSKELVRMIEENPKESRKQWMLNSFRN
jgi:hypothetical protein